MNRGWIVRIVKPMRMDPYAQGYFPRKTAYKKDAECIQDRVKFCGGEASIEKFPKEAK